MAGRRWTGSSRIYLGASIVLAVLTGARLHDYATGEATAVPGSRSLVPVVVASRPVARGHPLVASQLQVVRMPRLYAPPGALSGVEQAAGRVVLADLATGEAVTDTRLARVRAGPVASLVPPGLRAFAVPTPLPPGTVVPGDRVDVLATFGSGQPYTERVVEAVEVLFVLGDAGSGPRPDAATSALDPGTRSTNTLIVLVAPEQEERLAYARAFAALDVAIAPPPVPKEVSEA